MIAVADAIPYPSLAWRLRTPPWPARLLRLTARQAEPRSVAEQPRGAARGLGRREEALTAIDEAVTAYRALPSPAPTPSSPTWPCR